jgi:stearoyl-CoA desaturase (Delta-9 desaturase)
LPVANPSAELPSPDEVPERISLAVRLAVLAVIIVPIVGVIAAPLVVWGWGFRWTDFALLLTLYTLTGLGITVGSQTSTVRLELTPGEARKPDIRRSL